MLSPSHPRGMVPDLDLPLAGRRILVVEDEYLIANEVKAWLKSAGCEVAGPVPRAEQALDLIENQRPDAAVLDFNPGEGATTYPVADRLSLLGVPYLFATGDVRVLRRNGCSGRPLLEKPYVKAQLLHTLADLIAATSRAT